jgi:hypothetical protein
MREAGSTERPTADAHVCANGPNFHLLPGPVQPPQSSNYELGRPGCDTRPVRRDMSFATSGLAPRPQALPMPAAAPVLYKLPAAPVLYKLHISPRRWNVLLACQFGRMIAPQAPRTVAIAPPTGCKSFVHHVSLTQYTTTSPHHNPSKIIPPIKITSSPSRCTTGDAPVILTDTRGRAWPSENGQRLKNPSMCAF